MGGWEYLLLAAFLGLMFVVGISLGFRRMNRSSQLLRNWAARKKLTVLESDQRIAFQGPFTFTSGHNQVIFRVKVRQASGTIRSGWVRIGNVLTGLLSEEMEVRWDGDPREMMDYPADFPGGDR